MDDCIIFGLPGPAGGSPISKRQLYSRSISFTIVFQPKQERNQVLYDGQSRVSFYFFSNTNKCLGQP